MVSNVLLEGLLLADSLMQSCKILDSNLLSTLYRKRKLYWTLP